MLEYKVKDMGEGAEKEETKQPMMKEMRWKRRNPGDEGSGQF